MNLFWVTFCSRRKPVVIPFQSKSMMIWSAFASAWVLLSVLLFAIVGADLAEDKQALLSFANKLPHSRALNWNLSFPICKEWTGVTCSKDGSQVVAVRLPGVGFTGSIPPGTLSLLSGLQILSLRSNGISGNFPHDLHKLKNLSFLYLQYNNFSGPLPDDWSVWRSLVSVNLSNNRFDGRIPSSISSLNHLSGLDLANNLLSGSIPDLGLPSLQHFNVSYNMLSGQIPMSLRRFPDSLFDGNNISGREHASLVQPSVVLPNAPHEKERKPKKFGEAALLTTVVGVCVLGFAFCSFFLILLCSKKGKNKEEYSGKLQKGAMSPEKAVSRIQDASNRMTFFQDSNYVFDLEDLLTASAEVLGKGTFGMTYKAVLEDATTVVVKRLKDVSAGKREFEQQMEAVGNVKHENIVGLKAYYYSKDEKLIVYEYYYQGSVSSLLHGKNGRELVPLDWSARMKIALGTARGLACIHSSNGGKMVHGNIKSSNIFINAQQYGCISDMGLSSIMSSLALPISRAAGYRAPEVTDTRKATQPSDVYSFGVVLLELLTGKSPIHTTRGDEIIHLVRWVHSVVREEWTAEVFDVELMRSPNIEEELVEMLQIAMSCVVRVPDQRPKMDDLAKMIENVRRVAFENQPSTEDLSRCSSPPSAAEVTEDESLAVK